MGRQKSYVAGIVDAINTMEEIIAYTTPEIIAYEFLKSTLMDYPRPPWQTGALRRSGVVYIGGRKYMTTTDVAIREGAMELLGPNYASPYYAGAPLGASGVYKDIPMFSPNIGFGDESSAGYSTPNTLTLKKVKFKDTGSTGAISSLRSKITVMYQAPHAALMHEWPGGFSDMLSGAHYVSGKAIMSTKLAAFRIKQLTGSQLGRSSGAGV